MKLLLLTLILLASCAGALHTHEVCDGSTRCTRWFQGNRLVAVTCDYTSIKCECTDSCNPLDWFPRKKPGVPVNRSDRF